MRTTLVLTVVAGSIAASAGSISWADDPPPKEPDRFDMVVREDIFAGFGGNAERLAKGLKACDDALAKNPKHAEALVWRGAVRVFQSGQEFRAGKRAEGIKLWTAGMKDMDDAVALAPTNVGVRIPRAAVLLPTARSAPPAMGKPLLPKALDDFQTIEKLQREYLAELGDHPRGELRMGLADVHRLMGNIEKSNEQLRIVEKELPNTKYAERAKEWLAAKPDAKLAHNCIGCHRSK
jgi:hypothetical protein